MGHATASGRPQADITATENTNQVTAGERLTKVTKKDYDIRWEWQRGRLQGQENYGYYIVRSKLTGRIVARGFSSKRDASSWVGKNVKRINDHIKAGRIVVERNENGRVSAYTRG